MSFNAYASPGRRYQVHRPIGRGGFGTVYLADMLGDDGFVRAVALKVLNANVNDTAEVARRFRDEARVLGLLRHRAIVNVDGLVYLGERQALVMEYIDGADLGRIMKLGPIAPAPAVEIIGEVANALDVAYHTPGPDGRPLGLLHRDVKPSNVRITPVGEVKVLDFGVARADFKEREAFTKSYLLGSDGYMGPERFEGEDGPATDVYSLGVVLLEMLTGKTFGPTSIRPTKLAARVDAAILEAGGFHPPLEDLVRQMLSFEPDDRPSAAEVERRAWDLRRDLKGERLRDWASHNVQEAAAKVVTVKQDDLSGKILVESKGDTPAPGRPLPADPAAVPPAPFHNVTDAQLEDEWGEELPTVVNEPVRQAPPKKLLLGVGSKFSIPAVPKSTPIQVEPATEPAVPPKIKKATTTYIPDVSSVLAQSDSQVGGYTPPLARPNEVPSERPRRRPKPTPAAPAPPQKSARWAIGLGALFGTAAAVALGVWWMSHHEQTELAPTAKVEVVPEAPPPPAEPAPFRGPSPSTTTGSVAIIGDARAVRLVSASGKRYAAGLLKPDTYIVSADFGHGAKVADRFALKTGERVTVDCSQAARACSTYVH